MPINQIIKGDLVELAKELTFDVIVHGCNCHCAMKRGIAPQLAKAFHCDTFKLEKPHYKGDINKLGQIDYDWVRVQYNEFGFFLVNAYIQYNWSTENEPTPINYDAFSLCFQKLNHKFPGSHVGIPKIGAGLAGGDWAFISGIIDEKTPDLNITLVEYEAN